MDNFEIKQCGNEDCDYIAKKLVEYNLSQVPTTQESTLIDFSRKIVDQDGKVVAGLLGKMYGWNCLFIDILWVDQEHRKKGLGSKLLREVETLSKENGCYLVHLDTFDFQAKDFYIKNGYEVFGILDNCPAGHRRYFLKKLLA